MVQRYGNENKKNASSACRPSLSDGETHRMPVLIFLFARIRQYNKYGGSRLEKPLPYFIFSLNLHALTLGGLRREAKSFWTINLIHPNIFYTVRTKTQDARTRF